MRERCIYLDSAGASLPCEEVKKNQKLIFFWK